MRGSTFWLATGVLLFLAWGVSYFVFHVAGVLIHLLWFLRSCHSCFPCSLEKAEWNEWLALPSQRFYFRFACVALAGRGD